MTDDNHDPAENFKAIIAADTTLKSKWEAIADKVVGDAANMGVDLTREDVAGLPSARLATLTDEPLTGHLEELERLDAFTKARRDAELKAALEAGEDAAVEQLNSLPRYKRMSQARSMGLSTNDQPQKPCSVADEATMIRRLLTLSPSERMAKARAWGIDK